MAMALARPPTSAAPEQPARQLARLERPLRLRRGGVIEQPVVAYETWGRLNAARDNTVLLFTGLSPPAHAASSPADPKPGWWESMIGEGRPIDTSRYFVVCVNSLGSPYGSSGPASMDPRTGRPYGIGFPELSVEDIATGGREALRTLGIERVESAVAQPVLLCTPALRPHLWRLFSRVLPQVGVLSHNEIPPHVRVTPVAVLD